MEYLHCAVPVGGILAGRLGKPSLSAFYDCQGNKLYDRLYEVFLVCHYNVNVLVGGGSLLKVGLGPYGMDNPQ